MALGRGVLGLLGLLLLPAAVWGEDCQAYVDYSGKEQPAQSCPDFCCGSCAHRFCCSNVMLRFAQGPFQCVLQDGRLYVPGGLLNNIQDDDLAEHLDESSEKIKEAIKKMHESISHIRLG